MSTDVLGLFSLTIAITLAVALAAVAGTCTFLCVVAWAFSLLEANQSGSLTDRRGKAVRGETHWLLQWPGWRVDRPAMRGSRGAVASPPIARFGS